jgi:glycosyltransferase involved in cell wall biosynthesis
MIKKASLRVLLMAGSMEGGGSERQTCLLLKHLDRAQFQPQLYLTHRQGSLLLEIPEDVTIHSFDDSAFAPRVNWPGRYHRAIVSHLRAVIDQNLIDLVYDRTFHMSLLAEPACKQSPYSFFRRQVRKVPRVATIVSPPEQDLTRSELRFLLAKRRLLAKSYRRASRVLAVSEAVRKSAIDFYHLDPTHVQTVHNPVDVDALQNAVRCHEKALPSELTDRKLFHIACIGRMGYEKGFDLILHAMQQLENTLREKTILWCVGDGPLRNGMETLAGHLGIEPNVRFTGHVASAASILAKCDLLVCPSRYEGLPNVVLEAMALGIPVIATSVGGIPELIEDGVTGKLVPPESAAELAKAIATVMRADSTKLQQWSLNAKEKIKRDFSLEDYMKTIEEIFQKAIVA